MEPMVLGVVTHWPKLGHNRSIVQRGKGQSDDCNSFFRQSRPSHAMGSKSVITPLEDNFTMWCQIPEKPRSSAVAAFGSSAMMAGRVVMDIYSQRALDSVSIDF